MSAGYRAEPSAMDRSAGEEKRTRARRGHSKTGLPDITRTISEVERLTQDPVSYLWVSGVGNWARPPLCQLGPTAPGPRLG